MFVVPSGTLVSIMNITGACVPYFLIKKRCSDRQLKRNGFMFDLKSVFLFPPTCPGQQQLSRARGVSPTSTWVTSNIVISTPYPSKQHKESRGTVGKSDWTASQFPCNLSALAHPPSPSAVISQSFNTVIRLFFFIILFVKRVTICMCLRVDESIHPASHSFTSHLPCLLFLSLPLPWFLSLSQ